MAGRSSSSDFPAQIRTLAAEYRGLSSRSGFTEVSRMGSEGTEGTEGSETSERSESTESSESSETTERKETMERPVGLLRGPR